MELKRIHEERADPGPPGADYVDGGHVTQEPDPVSVDAEEVNRCFEDPRIGLHDPHVPRVDDTFDLHAESGTHLAKLESSQSLGHHPVGVRDNAEADAGLGQRFEAFATSR